MSLPGYITVEVLHEGVKSEVRRATRVADGRLVILKVPRAEAMTHQRLAELRHEHNVATRLRVGGVVQALALEERGQPFLVFEDFGGLSLARCFPGKVGLASFFNIALQITEALAAIHELGVIHKDLKPANIIINPRTGEVKLTDFAIASLLASEAVSLAPPDRLVGTLSYMAPEQTGRIGRGIDQRADLYALGVTFYELLTGRRPFPQSDAMELVHAHLARTPPPPESIEPAIGGPLAAIVMKLMAKNAEDRYRSAHSLRADLEHVRAAFGSDAGRGFAAGARRRGAEFRLPQRLYGRASERARLLDAFEHAARGSRALVLISGYSGTGKSALVHEVHQPIVARRGNFIAGKFDQYNRNVPFASLLQTLRQLVELVLAGTADEVERWRRRLTDALGAQVAVLADTLPDLVHVVGPQPPPPPVSAAEAQNRLHLAVLRFFGVFADRDHPLVVFLDDLQWADGATIRLLKSLVADHDLRHVLVIGAYRDHEVDVVHPLRKALGELETVAARIEHIHLAPLERGDVAAIVADALAEPVDAVEPLAAEIYQRTEGNPLFVREFLRVIHEGELIRWSPDLGRWTWDLAALRAASLPDDVAELLLDRIRRLAPEVRALLTCAACVGVTFDVATLAAVDGRGAGEIGHALWEAIRAGLVVPLDPEYRLLPYGGELPNVRLRFLHDRVRQAAHSLVDPAELPRLHRAIGRHLLQSLAARDRSELLDAVDHLNRGRAEITSAEERLELAGLDLEAGRRAKAATAHDAAVSFLRAGVSLLGESHWATHYWLIYGLYLELAECESLCGQLERAEEAFEVLFARAATRRDALAARSLRVVLYAAIGRSGDALATGLEALRLVGLEIADDEAALREAAAREREELDRRLADAPISALVDRPRASDPELGPVIKLITDLLAPAQLDRQALFEYLCLKQINLGLAHGLADASPYGWLVYAFYLTTARGAVREAYEFGEAALAVNARLGNADQVPRLNFVFGSILHYWRPLAEVYEYFERARYHGLETGDYIFVSYACSHAAIAQFGAGTPLRTVAVQTDESLHLMQRTRVASSTAALKVVRRLAACLQGESAGPTSFDGEGFDEEAFFAAAERDRLGFAALWYCTAKLHVTYLHGDLDGARRWMHAAERRLLNSSWYLTTEFAFYASLVLAATARSAGGDEALEARRRLEDLRGRYAAWAASCPENFAHKLALIDAERAALDGEALAAISAYDAAIALSHRYGAMGTEALAAELAGAFHLAAGRESLAASLFADAEAVYRRWGAAPRADALLAERGELLRSYLPRAGGRVVAVGEVSEVSVTPATTVDPRLDLSSAIKAAQTFAVEVDLAALLRKFMGILVENAGAERSVLALQREGGLVLVASYNAEQGVTLHDEQPLGEQDAPAGMLRFCQRSGRVLLSDDVDNNPSFTSSGYLRRVRPLSLACFPLHVQGQRIGALYLENRAMWGAFTPHRLEILRLLTTQLAIAIENARMFTALREARRSAEEASLAKSRFMLNMSHELRTPLNWIIGASELLAEEAGDDGNADMARDLAQITRAGRGLLGLISDVLDITQLESGRLVLEPARVSLEPIVREIVETHLPEIERNQSALKVQLDPSIGEVFHDRLKLTQVIGSVVRNAARFTERGTITLRAVREGERLRVEVADTGIGMTKQQTTKIFDPFHQADDSPTRKVGGMGLGLAICRRLCERMGGSISVVSELGAGSTFTIDLPLEVSR